MIETAFFTTEERSKLRASFRQRLPSRILASMERLHNSARGPNPNHHNRGAKASAQEELGTRVPCLDWSQTDRHQRNFLVEFIASNSPQGGYTNKELRSLKRMPIFETMSGDFTALEEHEGDGYYMLRQSSDALPESVTRTTRILRRHDDESKKGASRTSGIESKNRDASSRWNPFSRSGSRNVGTKVLSLYEQLDIKVLKDSDLMQKFIVPEFANLGRLDQNRFMHQMCERWSELRKQQPLVDALKKLKFVPVVCGNGDNEEKVACACDLLDPREQLLTEYFESAPHMFPHGEYATSGWLRVLSDLGLRKEMDKELLPQAAVLLEKESRTVFGQTGGADMNQKKRLVRRAKSLVLHFFDNFSNEFSQKMLSQLAEISFVPVRVPLDLGLNYGVSSEAASSKANGETGTSESSGQMVDCFVRFKDCALHKDRHLAWTVKPVLPETLEPPRHTWEGLGIINKQRPSAVLKHLQNVCGAQIKPQKRNRAEIKMKFTNAALFSYPEPAVQVMTTVFEFLQDKWTQFDAREREILASLPLIPVGGRVAQSNLKGGPNDASVVSFMPIHLVKASRTFFRMEVPLPPFLFEVPRVFGKFEPLLAGLGAAESPQTRDYVMFMRELHNECRGSALNPNELNAVLRVVRLLLKVENTDGGHTNGAVSVDSNRNTDFILPDSHGILRYQSECVARGNGWLDDRVGEILRRVDTSQIRFVSSFLSENELRTIGVKHLSDIVGETLVATKEELSAMESCIDSEITARVHDPTFARGVALALGLTSTSSMSRGVEPTTNGTGNTFNAIRVIAKTLSSVTVIRWPKPLRTLLFLKENLGPKMRKGTDCTRPGSESHVPFWVENNFDNCGGVRVVISEETMRLTQAITFDQILARCLAQLATEAVTACRSQGEMNTFEDSYARRLGDSGFSKSVGSAAINVGGFAQMKSVVSHGGLLAITSMINLEHSHNQAIERDGASDKAHQVEKILNLHGVFQDSDRVLELSRGCPGMSLLNTDREKLHFAPLHPFQTGEIVAFDREFLNSNMSAEPRNMRNGTILVKGDQLCYGVVVKNVGSSHNAVRRLRVKVSTSNADNSIASMLSSQVYTFLPTRAKADAPNGKTDVNPDVKTMPKSRKKTTTKASNEKLGTLEPLRDSADVAVGAKELIGAVHEILGRVGLNLDKDSQELMSETLTLRETTSKQENQIAQLKKENSGLRDRMLCKICMVNDVAKIILPSGKLLCGERVSRIHGVCPFTRMRVNNIVTVHFD